MNFSALRKASLYRREAVILAEELRSKGTEVTLEQPFFRENSYYCKKHGVFQHENQDLDTILCPSCCSPLVSTFYQVDLFLPVQNIAIEIKGKSHDSDSQQKKDSLKEQYLKNFGIETISVRAEWFLDSKHEPRYDWIALYSEGVAKLLSATAIGLQEDLTVRSNRSNSPLEES
jgi:hypothetical protein